MLDSRLVLAACAALILSKISSAATYAPLPALLADLFPTHVRYTGVSLGYQIGGILGGSLVPIVLTAIYAATGSSLLLGVYLAALTVVSLVAIALAHTPAILRRAAEGELTAGTG